MLALGMAAGVRAADAPEHIRWTPPWREGVTLVYETESLDDKLNDGKPQRTRATDTTEIRIAEVMPAGFLQTWSSRGARMELIEGDPATFAITQAAVQSLGDAVLEVELDKDANFHAIRNIGALGTRLREVMRPRCRRMPRRPSNRWMPASGTRPGSRLPRASMAW